MNALKLKVYKFMQRFEHSFKTLNRIEISKAALLHNFDYFNSFSPGTNCIPVLKSNAYGCGLEQISSILKEREFPYIAVDGYFEALRIRQVTKQPLLIMGYIHPDNIPFLDYHNMAFVVHDEEIISAFGALNKHVKIHLEINTGMNRYGIQPERLDFFISLIKCYKNLELDGVMSHLADADNEDNSNSLSQQRLFQQCLDKIFAAGFKPKHIHLAQTAGSIQIPNDMTNSIRVGIGLYGISPVNRFETLKPVASLKSTVAKVIELNTGDRVSYNGTYTASKPMKIGVLPIGYYEGVPRALSNAGAVNAGGKTLPIVGRVCMNHMMIDLMDQDLKVGDEVVIIDSEPQAKNSLENIAAAHNLFPYELMVKINENVRRVIV
jgi:alanine racemase